MSKVLVTGGRGFIGQPVVDELTKRGYEPEVYGLEEGGVEDARKLWMAMDGAQACIHLAGLLGTHELFDEVHRAIDVNVHGTANVLQACFDHKAGYVGISMPPVFPSIYTATKICANRLATAYHHSFGVGVSKVTAFNAYGPGQAYGPGHPQKIGPTFIIKALRNEPLPIWGDGTQTVDMIYVDDLAMMLVDALDFVEDETFDGGTGQAMTVNHFAKIIIDATDSRSAVEYLPMRRGEIPTEIVASGQGWDKLGWIPRFRHPDLETTIRWYANHLNEFPA